MNVLFVHSGSDLYGASRCLLRLSTRLARDGHTVRAIVPSQGPLNAELEKSGVSVEVHPELPVVTRQRFASLGGMLSLLIDVPRSVRHIWNVTTTHRPDIIHTNTALILSSGIVARLRRITHAWHVRESFVEFPMFFRLFQWYMYGFADVILCGSRYVAEQFSPWLVRNKTIVIHDGFPRDEFDHIDTSRVDAFRAKFNLERSLLVGVVGRIKYVRKGQEILVQAAGLMKGQFPDVKFVLIGSPFPGNEIHLTRLLELMRVLGVEDRVVYTGDASDIGAAYAALEISVLTSCIPEPFGGVVVESMAYGKPVIGTNIGGTPEQIEDGVTGLLVSPGDPVDLRDSLVRLLSDPDERRTMGLKARERFLQFFEFEPFYAGIMKVYRSRVAITK